MLAFFAMIVMLKPNGHKKFFNSESLATNNVLLVFARE